MINYIKRFWQCQMAEAYNYLPLCIMNLITKILFITIPLTILLVCCSCGSTKMVTQTVEHVSKDTIYLSNIQYDSIYVYQELDRDYRRGNPSTLSSGELVESIPYPSTIVDTIFIKDKSIEYKYRLLRDTVRIVKRDSIPYEVTITQVKEIARPLTWFDHLTRACFFILLGIVGFYIYRLIRKLKIGF